MQILVVSNRADFFREVFQVCRTLLGRQSVCHLSHDAWEAADLSDVPAAAGWSETGKPLTRTLSFPDFMENHLHWAAGFVTTLQSEHRIGNCCLARN